MRCQTGYDGVNDGANGVNDGANGVNDGANGVNDGVNGANGGVNGVNDGVNQKTVMDLIKEEPNISIAAISEKTAIPRRTIDRIISELKTTGVIMRIGTKRSGHWEIKEFHY
jgi:hypothetical protein